MARPGDARGGESSPNMGGGVTGGGRGERRAGMEGGGKDRMWRGGERGDQGPTVCGGTGRVEGEGGAGSASAREGRRGEELQRMKGLPTGGPRGGTMVGSRGGEFTMARGRGDRGGVEGQASGAGGDSGIGWGGSAVPPGTQRPGPEWGEATGGTRSPGMRGSGSSNGRGRQTWFIVTRLAWAFRDARSWSCESCPAMAYNRERLSQDDPESRCHIIGRDTLTGTGQKPGDSLWGEAVVPETRR